MCNDLSLSNGPRGRVHLEALEVFLDVVPNVLGVTDEVQFQAMID